MTAIIAIISRNEMKLKELFLKLEERSEEMELKINKIRYMKLARKKTNVNNIKIERYKFENK